MTAQGIGELVLRLNPDPWRAEVGFSEDIAAAHEKLFRPGITDDDAATVLNELLPAT